MQRQVADGIIITCDFCGTDWDQVQPMTEGHKGSVICLACLEQALTERRAADDGFSCTLCRRPFEKGVVAWGHGDPTPNANSDARVCDECALQAAQLFSKDEDVDFEWKEN